LIAVTNRHLCAEVLAGRSREDLLSRLSTIQLPWLRGRLEDISPLVQFFLKKCDEAYGKKIPGMKRRAQAVLLRHS
jgi:DNA-binding NtrC family response regulator